MVEILKYQRLQEINKNISNGSKISCSAIETSHLVVGKENGEIHVLSFSGQHIQKLKPHNSAVNCISLYFDGHLSIVSCSDDGTVFITTLFGDEVKEQALYSCHEPITAVCCETHVNSKKDRGILIGTAKGKMIYRKVTWFAQKEVLLWPGDGSPVYKIAWKGDFFAWADSSLLRIMDISSQTAICQLSPPYGIGVDDPYPCHLYWHNDSELLIGWGDSFRVLKLFSHPVTHSANGSDEGSLNKATFTKTISEWQTDTIICGLFPFDEEHVIYLGFTPPLDQTTTPIEDESAGGEWIDYDSIAKEEIELIIAHRKTGEIIEADVIPAGRASTNNAFIGPYHCHLLCTYQCSDCDGDYDKWSLHKYLRVRGGDRGNAPLMFFINAEIPGVLLSRLSNVTDQITLALEKRNLLSAIDLAYHHMLTSGTVSTSGGAGVVLITNTGAVSPTRNQKDNTSSTRVSAKKDVYLGSLGYSYEELLMLYVKELVSLGYVDKASKECARLMPSRINMVNDILSKGEVPAAVINNNVIISQDEEHIHGLTIWYKVMKYALQLVATSIVNNQSQEYSQHPLLLLENFSRDLPLSLTLATMVLKTDLDNLPDNVQQSGAKSIYDEVLYFLITCDIKIPLLTDTNNSPNSSSASTANNLFVELIRKWSVVASIKSSKPTSTAPSKKSNNFSTIGGPEAGELFNHFNMMKFLNHQCYTHTHATPTSPNTNSISQTVTTLHTHSSGAGKWTTGLQYAGASSTNREEFVQKRNSMLLALAGMYSLKHEHKKALICYLDITIQAVASSTSSLPVTSSSKYNNMNNIVNPTVGSMPHNQQNESSNMAGIMDSSEEEEKRKMITFKPVFDLIEQDVSLFPFIEQKIVNLVSLSKNLTAKLLLNHIDKLPISSVANQLLLHDRRALLWYLQLLLLDGHPSILVPAKNTSKKFVSNSRDNSSNGLGYNATTENGILHGMNLLFVFSASNGTAGDTYRINKQDYAEWHYKQLQLYVELITQRHAAMVTAPSSSAQHGRSVPNTTPIRTSQAYGIRPTPLTAAQNGYHSDFMQYLSAQLVSPERCLQECERKMSVFFPEIIFLYGILGQPRRALTLLLYETGDVGGAVRFLQEQYDQIGDQGSTNSIDEINNPSVDNHMLEQKRKEIIALWDEITDYVIKYPQTLTGLLDEVTSLLGHPVIQLHYAQFLPRIPSGIILPGLQPRLKQLLIKHAEHERLQRYCVSLLHTEARTLLTRKKHFQHRAIRVDPTGGHNSFVFDNEDNKPGHNYSGHIAAITNWKCASCSGPLLLSSNTFQQVNNNNNRGGEKVTLPVEKKHVTVWGAGAKDVVSSGCVIFNTKLAFHKACYENLPN